MDAIKSAIETTTIPPASTLPSATSPTPEEARTLLEDQSRYDLKQSTLYAVKDLARALEVGKKLDPNVTYQSRSARRLELQFMALSLALPLRQIEKDGTRPTDPDWTDLGSVLSSVSRDGRYLKRLCNNGWVPDNVVEPLRVVREIRAKLATIQRLAPEAQLSISLAA
jgi:hypothetical protein